MYASAFTIGMGYLVSGVIPLLPYFTPYAKRGLMYSCVVTGVVLLIFGAAKAHGTGTGFGARGYRWDALSMLCVGGCVACAHVASLLRSKAECAQGSNYYCGDQAGYVLQGHIQ